MRRREKYVILNVDDDDIQRYAVTKTLSSAGYEVIEASNGSEALEKAKENPDLIILDISLPDIDGFELCNRFRKIPDLEYVPIIHISSTYNGKEDVIKGLESGADGYLIHPVEPAVLIAYARAMLRLRDVELRLIEANKDWNETFNALTSAIILVDNNNIIKKCNKYAYEMLDVSNKVEGKNIESVFTLWGLPDVLDNFKKLIEGKNFAQGEFKLNDRYYRYVINPIMDRNKELKNKVFVFTDMSDYKLMEEEYRQAQKMEAIGRLTGGIAHDFNNMLTVIIGYSDFILMNLKETDPTRKIIEEIKKAGQMASELTQKLLAFSRKQTVNPESINLNIIIEDMRKLLKRMIGEDIELVTDLDENLGNIIIDRTQIEQVIMNIVVNARDAMPNGGILTIETRNTLFDEEYTSRHMDTKIKRGGYVMLAISDTGVGMDEETKSHIFEPFFTTKGSGRGTGLGLATVYGIVKQNNGYIWVYSQPGKGTTFKIYFPLIKETDKVEKEPENIEEKTKGTETVLLVEDEDLVRDMMLKGLSSLGYKVLSANGPKEALRVIDNGEKNIDIVVTDVVMPGMNGKELVGIIKEKLPSTKILYISGYTDRAIVSGGVLKRNVNYLQKPFTPLVLAKKIRQILDNR